VAGPLLALAAAEEVDRTADAMAGANQIAAYLPQPTGLSCSGRDVAGPGRVLRRSQSPNVCPGQRAASAGWAEGVVGGV
jgi:hypothetical protein